MQLDLRRVEGRFSVCRLPPGSPEPAWARGIFTSVTRTPEELSVVCVSDDVPEGVQAERDFSLLAVEGPIAFEATGVAAALVSPLASAGISVLLIATFDTDYLLVKENVFERALVHLKEAGHRVR